MSALTFRIRLKTPVLATQTESGEPNSATAFDYIPGSMIRGALIARMGGNVADLPVDPEMRRLFFSGDVHFLNAYPFDTDSSSNRLLPAPLSWRERDGQIYDFAIAIPDALPSQSKLKRIATERFSFVDLKGEQVRGYAVRRQITVHNASDDRNRKQAQLSTVYRYDAIAEGELFSGVILGEASLLNKIKLFLSHEVLLGGSRTGGYGLAEFENVSIEESWAEYQSAKPEKPDQIVITLLSDVIVQGASGQYLDTLDEVLGARTPPIFKSSAMRVVGGFNRKWGLPLVQTWAIAAGSVFVYAASGVDAQKIVEAKRDGVGERRLDGFGRIAVDWNVRSSWQSLVMIPQHYEALQKEPLNKESRALAKRMAQRQLQVLLEEHLVAAVVSKAIRRSPSKAQLSRVRTAARQSLFQKSMTPLEDFLKDLWDDRKVQPNKVQPNDPDQAVWEKRKLKPGGRQLNEARIEQTTLLRWLDARVKLQPGDLEKQLGLESSNKLAVAGETADIAEIARLEYTVRLIDGVIQRAAKAQRQKEVRHE